MAINNTIFKYPINVGQTRICLPIGAEVLCVQTQNDEPYIWASVERDAKQFKNRNFVVYGTGHSFGHNQEPVVYIGTFQLDNGQFVGHLFEML